MFGQVQPEAQLHHSASSLILRVLRLLPSLFGSLMTETIQEHLAFVQQIGSEGMCDVDVRRHDFWDSQ